MGCGGESIFRLTLGGSLQPLHAFPVSGADGTAVRKPMLANDGLLYGVASWGGAHDARNYLATESQRGLHEAARLRCRRRVEAPQRAGSEPGWPVLRRHVRRRRQRRRNALPPDHARDRAPLLPEQSFVRRDQMAVFLLKTSARRRRTRRPRASGEFEDVGLPLASSPTGSRQLAAEGITAGCGMETTSVRSSAVRARTDGGLSAEGRARLRRSRHRRVTGDLPRRPLLITSSPTWVEQLFAEKESPAVAVAGFCPTGAVTRAQMAVFLLKLEHGAKLRAAGVPAPVFGRRRSARSQFADVDRPALRRANHGRLCRIVNSQGAKP